MGTKTGIVNAIITRATLGYEDHGILTCGLWLKGEGWECLFGDHVFDGYDATAGKRVAFNGFGVEYIRAILDTVGVRKWEELDGKIVRAHIGNLGDHVSQIGHPIEDRWFRPAELAAGFRKAARP